MWRQEICLFCFWKGNWEDEAHTVGSPGAFSKEERLLYYLFLNWLGYRSTRATESDFNSLSHCSNSQELLPLEDPYSDFLGSWYLFRLIVSEAVLARMSIIKKILFWTLGYSQEWCMTHDCFQTTRVWMAQRIALLELVTNSSSNWIGRELGNVILSFGLTNGLVPYKRSRKLILSVHSTL